jgi:hypothetical protein
VGLGLFPDDKRPDLMLRPGAQQGRGHGEGIRPDRHSAHRIDVQVFDRIQKQTAHEEGAFGIQCDFFAIDVEPALPAGREGIDRLLAEDERLTKFLEQPLAQHVPIFGVHTAHGRELCP